ncbi:HD domain-containing protein [Saccharothrix xinjiangensis]|uniref:iHD-CE domain-containing protein n=1 Tax=Saccharothrix xinjiangensis TaxID=204798 RepID=A0ABV9Y8Z3_9PSEU
MGAGGRGGGEVRDQPAGVAEVLSALDERPAPGVRCGPFRIPADGSARARTARAAASAAHVGPLDLLVTGGDEDRESYERHLAGPLERRLVARAAQRDLSDRSAASEEIAWWLFHRWVATREDQPAVLEAIPVDDRPTRKVLVDVLDRLTRLFRLPPGDLGVPQRLDLKSRTTHLGGVEVRERLLGLLLVVGHTLAVEPIALSPVVVEHLGVPNPVDLAELRTTLGEATWEPIRIGLGLVAECRHEAVPEALREHVARVDAVLGAVHSVAEDDVHLQPLRHLPARASADRVEPAAHDGHPIFAVPVTRFRLEQTRVRELLMGEQLYGDRSLAIRELYQNALDACRYRQARQDYRIALGLPGGWTGRIGFDQGVDDQGRHYLRCTDNGIGMGAQELREVFSQAGVRFADRSEFLEEQAQWAERGVHLYPNSRFGIGVMSYFMPADEIEVTTCRMDRHDGRPGRSGGCGSSAPATCSASGRSPTAARSPARP